VQVEELQLARKKDKEASADAAREQERTFAKQAGEMQSLKSRLMVSLTVGCCMLCCPRAQASIFLLRRWHREYVNGWREAISRSSQTNDAS